MTTQRTRALCVKISCRSRFAVLIVCLAVLGSSNCALGDDEIRLKNGAIVRGTVLFTNSLTGRAVTANEMLRKGDDVRPTRNIVRVENGWQYIFFPVQQQAAAANSKTLPLAPAAASYKITPPRTQIPRVSLASPGPITFTEPFSEFGVRRLTMQGPKKEKEIIQAITLVASDHVMIESLNCDWKFGVALKSLPPDLIEKLVRKKVDSADEHDRYGLTRFYIQAELYDQAFRELESIRTDFANRKELVERAQTDQAELMNYFGSQILRHLGRRKRAAQHVLAESYAKKLITQPLSGPVRQDVEEYLGSYQEARQNIERAKLLLGDWQAKITDSQREERLQAFRSEVNEQLDFETLPRLDAFLKAELDNQYEPSDRLALAYSGWLLGSANAVTDLDQTVRFWDARQLILDYLRTDDAATKLVAMKALKSTESVGPETVLKLIARLPPILDSSDLQPGVAHQVTVVGTAPASYRVMLPAEYSPHHDYPLVIALRSQNHTTEDTLQIWGGDPGHPDLGNQRGYIVVAPEYVDKAAKEYTFGTSAHDAVLNCLIDARQRFSVDSDRVFLAGHGMGADAAFDIGMAHADEFAGVLPIGGDALNYCKYYWENSGHTAWYIVGKGYDTREGRDTTSNQVLNNLLTQSKFDVMLVEYIGRSGVNMTDEVPKFYDWMELASHVRAPLPKEFHMRSMRKADNRFFWISAGGLPRDYVLPLPADAGVKITPMDFHVRIPPAANTLFLPDLTKNYTIRLTPELVDFDKPVDVKIGSRKVAHELLKPEVDGMLEELRARGDRKRLPLAVIRPKS